MDSKVDDTVNAYSEKCKLVGLTVLSPHIRQQVHTLLNEGTLGLSFREVEVMNPRSSFPMYEGEENDCDRFQLVIPYAGTPLECMVVFQSTDKDCPPDFVFSDPRFFVPLSDIRSLRNWVVEEPEALLSALKEIIQVYKKMQIAEVEKHPVLSHEYLCLFQLTDFDESDIEILVPSEPEGPVHFLIRLHVEMHRYFSGLFFDGFQIEENPLLLVSFPDRNSNKSFQRLYLTKNMETLLGIEESFQASVAIGENYLARYIMAIESDLRSRCELAASSYERRKIYFIKFLSHFATSVVEYDVMFYTCMVLLLKQDEFHFVVEINLPEKYPYVAPTLIFRSIYHSSGGAPTSIAINSYSYHPNWPVEKVLAHTVKFMMEYAPIFKDKSTSRKSPAKPV